MQVTNSETGKSIFCPVDLPIPYVLTLGDAACLKSQFEECLKGFRDGMAKASPEALLKLDANLVNDTIISLSKKIRALDDAMYQAKVAYAHKQIASQPLPVANLPLKVGCFVRIKATGYVGKLGNIYHNDNRETGAWRTHYGVDWASEYNWDELERITPAQYHASPDSLKLGQNNRG